MDGENIVLTEEIALPEKNAVVTEDNEDAANTIFKPGDTTQTTEEATQDLETHPDGAARPADTNQIIGEAAEDKETPVSAAPKVRIRSSRDGDEAPPADTIQITRTPKTVTGKSIIKKRSLTDIPEEDNADTELFDEDADIPEDASEIDVAQDELEQLSTAYLKELENVYFGAQDSISSDTSYVQDELKPEPNFFDELGSCPSMGDVRLSVDEQARKRSRTSLRRSGDWGVFVDPVTGVAIEESEEEEEALPEEEEEASYEEEESFSIPEDDDLLVLLEMEKEDEVIVKPVDDDTFFETLLTGEKEVAVVTEDKIDLEELQRIENTKLLKGIAEQFLHDLIANAVEQSEYVDPREVLRSILDKRQLIDKIDKLIREMEVEQRVCKFLNRKAVDHFRRKQNYRAISVDDTKTLGFQVRKLQGITRKLNELLGREEELKMIEEKKIEVSKSQLENMKVAIIEKENDLERCMRGTFTRRCSEHLREVLIPKSLQEMSEVREEFAQVRFQLIKHQHTKAILSKKLNDLEYLGNGLYMSQFASLQADVQLKGKKVEERNSDLSRSRYRYNEETHMHAHIFEKSQKLRNFVFQQKIVLQQFIEHRAEVRKRVHKLKLARKSLRTEIEQLSLQCGLLDKPSLMNDYDETEKKISEKRRRVERLRADYKRLLRKIAVLENENC